MRIELSDIKLMDHLTLPDTEDGEEIGAMAEIPEVPNELLGLFSPDPPRGDLSIQLAVDGGYVAIWRINSMCVLSCIVLARVYYIHSY
jgi:hypothetical protein